MMLDPPMRVVNGEGARSNSALPRALLGKSSIRYIRAEGRDKRKRQSYQVFIDVPLELHGSAA